MAIPRQITGRTRSEGLASHIFNKPQFMTLTVFSDGTVKAGKGLARGLPTKKGLAKGFPYKPQRVKNRVLNVFYISVAHWQIVGKPLASPSNLVRPVICLGSAIFGLFQTRSKYNIREMNSIYRL